MTLNFAVTFQNLPILKISTSCVSNDNDKLIFDWNTCLLHFLWNHENVLVKEYICCKLLCPKILQPSSLMPIIINENKLDTFALILCNVYTFKVVYLGGSWSSQCYKDENQSPTLKLV